MQSYFLSNDTSGTFLLCVCTGALFAKVFFRHCETKSYQQNRDAPPRSYALQFSIPEISETQKGSSTNFIGTLRQKKFQRRTVISPSYASIFMIPEIF